jgi:hypothetical protein
VEYKKKDQKGEPRSCYNCGKPGHLSRNCHSKNKVTRQLNVLTSSQEEEAEEWQVVDHSITRTPTGIQLDVGRAIIPIRETKQVLTDTVHEIDNDLSDLIRTLELQAYDIPNTEHIRSTQDMVKLGLQQGWITPNDHTNYAMGERNAPGNPRYYSMRHPDMQEPVKQEPPHPGTRVPTVWDYQVEDSEQSADETLSTERLAIHTPPDSPKLVRQNATLEAGAENPSWWKAQTPTKEERRARRGKERANYANDQQALIIHDTESPYRQDERTEGEEPDDWVTHATKQYNELQNEYQEQKIIVAARNSIKYIQDTRNLKHSTLSWTACTTDTCGVHYQEKEGSGWFPRSTTKQCKWQWFDCPKPACAQHLWDKRITATFHPNDETFDAAQNLLVNGSCIFPLWHQCLQEDCEKHQEDKVNHGYLDLGAEEEYSDAPTEEEDNSFLEQRLAPGISPGVVMRPIQELLSDSQ